MSERCVDASVAVKWAIKGEPFRGKAQGLLRDSGARGIILIAPYFFKAETDTAVRRRVYKGVMTGQEAAKAFAILDHSPVQMMDLPGLSQKAREIAERFNQPTVYDSVYAALAEIQGCELWTADKKFYDAVKGNLKFVKFLPEYP